MKLSKKQVRFINHLKKYLSIYRKKLFLYLFKAKKYLCDLGVKMIGPIEKGFKRAAIEIPAEGNYKGIDLSILPEYISYKSALMREKLTLYYILSTVLAIFFVSHCTSRLEITSLNKKLREKEYILAPGVLDFTTAAPQMVSESYVHDAAVDFITSLGNISSENVEEQYRSLKRFMSKDLKVQFEVDTVDWIEQVKTDNISQILSINDVEITTNSDGAYKVVALAKAEFYSEQEFLGYEDQVIDMVMQLVPPKSGKRWYLEINSLSWDKAKTFRAKEKYKKSK